MCFYITIFLTLLTLSAGHDYVLLDNEVEIGNTNNPDPSDGQNVSSAGLPTGDFVITWYEINSTVATVKYVIINSNGKITHGPIDVSTDNTYYNNHPAVATDTTGGFAIIWNWKDQPSDKGSVNNVYVRYYDSKFIPGNPIRVNDFPPSAQPSYMNPTINLLSNGKFLCLWNPDIVPTFRTIYSQQLTPGAVELTSFSNFQISQSVNKIEMVASAASLGNGSFVTVWATNNYGASYEYDIAAIIRDENDYHIVKSQWKVDTTTGFLRQAPTVKANDTYFIIAWWDFSGDKIKAQLYDLTGNPGVSDYQVSTSAKCKYPAIETLGADGFVIMYKCGDFNTYFQFFKPNCSKDGGELLINTTPLQINNFPYLSYNKTTGRFVAVYASLEKAYAKILYKNTGLCSDFTVQITSLEGPFKIEFSDAPLIFVTSFPSNGVLKDSGGSSITSIAASSDEIYYWHNTTTDDFFNFSTKDGGTVCKVTLSVIPCYTSCLTCTATGISTDHKCLTCGIVYYKLSDIPTDCYNTTNSPKGYVLIGSTWEKCYNLCKTCNGPAATPDIDMKCTSCVDSYYHKEDSMTSCFQGDIPDYTFNGSIYTKKPKAVSCYSLCKTCTAYPVNLLVDMLCNSNSCIDGYFPKEDNLTSCFQGVVSGYQLEGSVYRKVIPSHSNLAPLNPPQNNCYKLCANCSGYPTNPSMDMLCLPNSCIGGYYPKVDKMTSCFNGSIPKFYLDGYVYQKCHPLCQSCSKYPTDPGVNMFCDSCIPGFYPKSDNPTSCFTGDLNEYYLDIDVYKKCYDSCISCNVYGTANNHSCKLCKEEYFPIEGLTNCYPKDEQIEGYTFYNSAFIKCFETCKTCKGPGSLAKPNCISCKDGHTCEPCGEIIYNNQCITSCPNTTVYDPSNNTCLFCKDKGKHQYQSTCVDNCPLGYTEIDHLCVTCDEAKLLNLNGVCIESCPLGYIKNMNLCSPSMIRPKFRGCVYRYNLSKRRQM
jgi:hypothetical protein